jgi:5-methylcytosine-specific restriction endonuclease McrA
MPALFFVLYFASRPKGDSIFRFAKRSVRLLKSKGQRYLIWLSQDGHCAMCGTFVDCDESYHIDHMKAWSKGGATELYNLQLLCPSCNLRKGARDLEELCSSGCTSIAQFDHEV